MASVSGSPPGLTRWSRAARAGGADGTSDWMPGSSPGMSQEVAWPCAPSDSLRARGTVHSSSDSPPNLWHAPHRLTAGLDPAVQSNTLRWCERHLRLDARVKPGHEPRAWHGLLLCRHPRGSGDPCRVAIMTGRDEKANWSQPGKISTRHPMRKGRMDSRFHGNDEERVAQPCPSHRLTAGPSPGSPESHAPAERMAPRYGCPEQVRA